jgi:hypothetical protein
VSEMESASPSPRVSKSAMLPGTHFFGDNFNTELALAGASDGSLERLALSNSPLGTPTAVNSPGGTHSISKSRQVIDIRRQLVLQLFEQYGWYPPPVATNNFQAKHSDMFPSKNVLQLKIREVRQRMMAGRPPGSAVPKFDIPIARAGAVASASAPSFVEHSAAAAAAAREQLQSGTSAALDDEHTPMDDSSLDGCSNLSRNESGNTANANVSNNNASFGAENDVNGAQD